MRDFADSGVGRGAARVTSSLNFGICAQDNASAITLDAPGICLITAV